MVTEPETILLDSLEDIESRRDLYVVVGYRNKKGIDPISSGEEITPRSGQESEKKMAKFPPQSKDGG